MSDENKVLSCVGVVVLAIVVLVVGTVMNGWVLSVLWSWFVSPLFGLPNISVPAAIGFALVVGLLTHQKTPEQKDKTTGQLIAEIIGQAIVAPLFSLLVGKIILAFM